MLFHPNYHFSGQKESEEVIVVLHRHWFNILQNFFSIIAMFFILLGGYILLPTFFSELQEKPFNVLFAFLENSGFMIIFVLFFLVWIDYYFDIWIITTERVVNVEQKGLFNREVSELNLEKIQDITTEVRGIIPTFLNYGDVFIQTAGEKERFVLADIPNPYRIKDIVMSLQRTEEEKEKTDLGNLIKNEIHKDEF
jgi:uncharacterized membrane protein YdbT with pleckstrin-like domain